MLLENDIHVTTVLRSPKDVTYYLVLGNIYSYAQISMKTNYLYLKVEQIHIGTGYV